MCVQVISSIQLELTQLGPAIYSSSVLNARGTDRLTYAGLPPNSPGLKRLTDDNPRLCPQQSALERSFNPKGKETPPNTSIFSAQLISQYAFQCMPNYPSPTIQSDKLFAPNMLVGCTGRLPISEKAVSPEGQRSDHHSRDIATFLRVPVNFAAYLLIH